MVIDIKNLKENIKSYNDLLEEYEGNYLNYYNIISSFSFFWNDTHANRFFQSIPKEKLYYKNILTELTSIRDIYKYLYLKYSELGNHISINLKQRDSILLKFDDYIRKANNILNRFNDLNLSFCPNEAKIILSQKQKLIKNISLMRNNRKKIKDYFDRVEEIEQMVKFKVRNIDVSIIKETNIENMI